MDYSNAEPVDTMERATGVAPPILFPWIRIWTRAGSLYSSLNDHLVGKVVNTYIKDYKHML